MRLDKVLGALHVHRDDAERKGDDGEDGRQDRLEELMDAEPAAVRARESTDEDSGRRDDQPGEPAKVSALARPTTHDPSVACATMSMSYFVQGVAGT